MGRWQEASGTESANAHSFLTELCDALELPRPDPARKETEDNAYVFERKVTFRHADGSESYGFIDCYRPRTWPRFGQALPWSGHERHRPTELEPSSPSL